MFPALRALLRDRRRDMYENIQQGAPLVDVFETRVGFRQGFNPRFGRSFVQGGGSEFQGPWRRDDGRRIEFRLRLTPPLGGPMKRLIVAVATVAVVGLAHAADLPTTKAPEGRQSRIAGRVSGTGSMRPRPTARLAPTASRFTARSTSTPLICTRASTKARPPTRSITAFRGTPTRANGSPAITASAPP